MQKQIAALISQITPNQISRIERGLQLPNLKIALKLGIIYQTPLRELFNGAFEMCRKELIERGFSTTDERYPAGSSGIIPTKGHTNKPKDPDQCTFEENLKSTEVKDSDLKKAHEHIAGLIRLRTEKMDHI